MKKATSIFLLFSLLYNAFGYYALLAFEKSQASNLAAESVMKTNYKIIRFPISAYVHLEDTDFEDASGQFEYEGQTYNMVKQRRINDTLEIYALHNERQDQIADQMNEYIKDQLNSSRSPVEKNPFRQLFKSIRKNYTLCQTLQIIYGRQGSEQEQTLILFKPSAFAPVSLYRYSPPPEAA